MINKNKADQPTYSLRNHMLFQLEVRRNSELIPKYQKLKERQSFKFKEFLKLIDKGQKSIQRIKTKRNIILEKIDLSLVQLEKTPKATSTLKVVQQKANSPIYKRHKKVSTEEPQEDNHESIRIKQLKQKMNLNQCSIRFPQLALVKEALIIQQSLITEKKSKEKQKLKTLSNRKQVKQGTNLANIHCRGYKKHQKSMNYPKSSHLTIDYQLCNSKITQWTVAKWD